jgi:hypothetical protein
MGLWVRRREACLPAAAGLSLTHPGLLDAFWLLLDVLAHVSVGAFFAPPCRRLFIERCVPSGLVGGHFPVGSTLDALEFTRAHELTEKRPNPLALHVRPSGSELRINLSDRSGLGANEPSNVIR